jgi:hypothetical protein
VDEGFDLFVQGRNPSGDQQHSNARHVGGRRGAHEVKERADALSAGRFRRGHTQFEHRDGACAKNRVPQVDEEFVDVFVAGVRCSVGQARLDSDAAQRELIYPHTHDLSDGSLVDGVVVDDRARATRAPIPYHSLCYLQYSQL